MNDENRELIERGTKSLNELYGRNFRNAISQIEYPDIPENIQNPENVIQISLEDLEYLRAIRTEAYKYPHLTVTDIQRMFPSLNEGAIKYYFNILSNVEDEQLFDKPIDTPGELYKETSSDIFNKGIRHISKIHTQISDWFTRMRNIIPSWSTIYNSLELLKDNFKENHPNAVFSGKVLIGMALVALGTYGAKKIYDYVFKNDKTIENEELGLPKPEVVVETLPLAKIKPTEMPTVKKEIIEDVREPIPAIKPVELKMLEEIMQEPPKYMQVDHSLYIKQKIDRILRSKIKYNRQWEPYTYYRY